MDTDDQRQSINLFSEDQTPLDTIQKGEQVNTPSDLYHYYRDMRNEDIEHKIRKDLTRTNLQNNNFKIDYKSGENRLFNVLNAYAMCDPEIGYC